MTTFVHSLLNLPATKQIRALPRDLSEPFEAIMRSLREQASAQAEKAAAARHTAEADTIAEYWRVVSLYAKYLARAIRRSNDDNDHAKISTALMEAVGVKKQFVPDELTLYAGWESLKAPAARQRRCMLQVSGELAFAPWIDDGDYIDIDLHVRHLCGDALYLAADRNHYLTIVGFHKSSYGEWFLHKTCGGMPYQIDVVDAVHPVGYEIVGVVQEVFKRVKK